MNTLTFDKRDWDKQAYSVLKKLNGVRFSLEECLDAYYPKENGKNVFDALSSFFISQSLVYEELSGKLPERENLLFSTYAGLAIAASSLSANSEGYATDLFDNKRISLEGNLNETQNNLLHFLVEQLSLPSHKLLEDIVSSYFHCLQANVEEFLDEEMVKKFPQEVEISNARFNHQKYNFFSQKGDNEGDNNTGGNEEGKNGKKSADTGSKEYRPFGNGGLSGGGFSGPSGLGSLFGSNRRKSEKIIDLEKDKIPVEEEQGLRRPLYDYIAGHEQVKREFKRLAVFVKNLPRFEKRIPRQFLFQNYLLVGPPGTGKTTLVKSLARQCGLLFTARRGVEFGSSYINETALNIDALYKSAEGYIKEGKYPGVIIFIDEIDHLAKRRGYGRSSEDDKVITTLNTRLDGSGAVAGVITIGATNKEEMMDDAILSRFKRFHVGYPATDASVVAIYTAIIKKAEDRAQERLFSDIDYRRILEFSRRDERYKSGRAIEKIVYEAVIDKEIQSFQKGVEFQPVTTAELYKAHQSYDFEERGGDNHQPSRGGRGIMSMTR